MKTLKRVLVSTMALMMVMFCGIALTACGTSIVGKWEVVEITFVEGDESETIKKGDAEWEDMESYIEFTKDGKVIMYETDGDEVESDELGTWKKSGKNKYVFTPEDSEEESITVTVKNGRFSMSEGDEMTLVYAKMK